MLIKRSLRTMARAVVFLVVPCAHAEQYTLTDLGTLGGNEAAAYGINASGQVVGGSQTIPNDHVDGHAFLYSDGGPMSDLGSISGGNWSYATAINANGAITGAAGIAGGPFEAVIFDNGRVTGLGTLGGTTSVGNSINSRGQVVGSSSISGGGTGAFLYTPGQGMTDIGTLPGGTQSIAEGINNRGTVVGYGDVDNGATSHAFLYSHGKMSDLGTLPTTGNAIGLSAATAINAAGVVVGYSSVGPGYTHAFSYSPGVGMSDLGALGGGEFSVAWGVSNNGQIVGGSYLANGSEHGFLFTDGKMIDLNTLLSPSVASLYTVVVADGINNRGQIAASGYLNSNPSYSRAFLLTPASTVPSLLARLKAEVIGVGPGASLVDKVALAQTYYAASDIFATCAVLTAFSHEVRAQEGKKIRPDLATKLISHDAEIQAALKCPY